MIILEHNQLSHGHDTDTGHRNIRQPEGGVGKTTLCVTFANYLVTKGKRVLVIDCDTQQSVAKCRKADIRKYGEEHIPYDVLAYGADDRQAMTA